MPHDHRRLGLPAAWQGLDLTARIDGPATDALDFGALAALGDDTRAYYPALRRALEASGGVAPAGLSSEADVDAFLASDRFSLPPASRRERAYLFSLDALFDRTRGVLEPHPLFPGRRPRE